jgi:hypothetical protein
MAEIEGGSTSKVEAVMARIRASLPAAGARLPTGGGTSRTLAGETNIFSDDVYRSLRHARTIGGGITITYNLGWRTPIVGQVWMLVRSRIHQEIRIYIDALTTQQSNLNTHLVRALAGVVEGLDGLGLPAMRRQQESQGEAIAKLQSELDQLRVEVQALRAAIGNSDDRRLNGSVVGQE